MESDKSKKQFKIKYIKKVNKMLEEESGINLYLDSNDSYQIKIINPEKWFIAKIKYGF